MEKSALAVSLLPSRTKLQCMLQLRGQIETPSISSLPCTVCTLWLKHWYKQCRSGFTKLHINLYWYGPFYIYRFMLFWRYYRLFKNCSWSDMMLCCSFLFCTFCTYYFSNIRYDGLFYWEQKPQSTVHISGSVSVLSTGAYTTTLYMMVTKVNDGMYHRNRPLPLCVYPVNKT
jgi:hypothetical protein